jgi:hypothetical protein
MKVPIKRLIDHCFKIADSAADRHGFVAIRNLASACNCQVVARPLLAEAAITTSLESPGKWVVLINNEIHQFSDEDFEFESSLSPLRVRTRNTLAHEVAHATAFDLLGMDFAENGNLKDKLESIERVVESVSPLLLLPKSFVMSLLRQIESADESLRAISKIPVHFGVSREVFIQSLKTLSKYERSSFIQFDPLLGALWGILEFRGKGSFKTSARWTFDNHSNYQKHPASTRILKKTRIDWTVDSIQKIEDKIYCLASPTDSSLGLSCARFEIEEHPQRSGQKILYRLGSKISEPQKRGLRQFPPAHSSIDSSR